MKLLRELQFAQSMVDCSESSPSTNQMTMAEDSSPRYELLLVDDSPIDLKLAQIAFEKVTDDVRLHAAEDGEQALAFLNREGQFAGAPRPHLILVDLNMPNLNGLQFLGKIKNDDRFKRIPVIVFTTSDSQRDILNAYDAHANAYLTKPVDLDQSFKLAECIYDFWLSFNKLPSE